MAKGRAHESVINQLHIRAGCKPGSICADLACIRRPPCYPHGATRTPEGRPRYGRQTLPFLIRNGRVIADCCPISTEGRFSRRSFATPKSRIPQRPLIRRKTYPLCDAERPVSGKWLPPVSERCEVLSAGHILRPLRRRDTPFPAPLSGD